MKLCCSFASWISCTSLLNQMLPPPRFPGLDVLVAERTPIGHLRRLQRDTVFVLDMLIIFRFVDGFFASAALREFSCLFAFFEQMLVVSFDLDDLRTVLALSQHQTVLPEVHVQGFIGRVSLIRTATKLAFLTGLFLLLFLLGGTLIRTTFNFRLLR